MSKTSFCPLFLLGVSGLTSAAAYGQVEIQVRPRRMPGWDARVREGRCEIRVWVDNRAEVRLRGETIFVRTLEGSKSRDEGSECSQPLPFNRVQGFQIRQISGRTRVILDQEPNRMNNFSALIGINDSQGGGDVYAFEVSWRAEGDVSTAPAPFFDDVRACQDAVRQTFLSRNGRGAYIDFDSFADHRNQDQGRGQRGRQEMVQGRGNARNPTESRELTYSCAFDVRLNRVTSANYQFSGNSLRGNERSNDRRQLR